MELRFLARDGDFLVFETIEGLRLSAPIDESLTAALRAQARPQANGVSPRAVQDLLRSGLTLEETARTLGVDESSISPFAAPILDEISYVLQQAKQTLLPHGNRMREFGDIASESLPGAMFRAFKDDKGWNIEISSPAGKQVWLFQPRTRSIEPLSESAKALSRSLHNHHPDVVSMVVPEPMPVSPPTVLALEEDSTDDGTVLNLVEQLRARREAKQELKPSSAKGRASLPSWDEIVLGAGALNPDSDQGNS